MAKTRIPDSSVIDYFSNPSNPPHKQYLALRMFFLDGKSAEEVSIEYGYHPTTIYTFAQNFKETLKKGIDPFFVINRTGPKEVDRQGDDADLVVAYRKKMLSIPEIQILMSGLGRPMSAGLIGDILHVNGFTRMPKRDKDTKEETYRNSGYASLAEAQVSVVIDFIKQEFFITKGGGLLCFLPIIKRYRIDKLIERSEYPGTKQIPTLNAILCFLALKLLDFERYGHDDLWSLDRGLGLFAGLNVLPKTTWFSIYSSKTTRDMNIKFLKACNQIWRENGLLGDTVNMDFVAIPYWGASDTFENNWSGSRRRAITSIQAALAHDSESGIICYGDTTVLHENQNEVVLEFLDFYQEGQKEDSVKYLVFDSKFTTLGNLGKLDDKGIKFVTIQRKSEKQQEKVKAITKWEKVRISLSNHKGREVTYAESEVKSNTYGKDKTLRQIFIKGRHIQTSCIITNEFSLNADQIIRKYARRWMIENEIQEHIDFFHLNSNSSGIVIKVDFDLTMTILAHNLYRLLANEIPRYNHCTAKTLFNSFIDCIGEIEINDSNVDVRLNLHRSTPLLLEALPKEDFNYQWIGNKKFTFGAGKHS